MSEIEAKEDKPAPRKSLKTNLIFNLISQILLLLIPLATSPYLARVLGAEVNGQISFSASIITYFTLISNFGFATYGQREIARHQNDKAKRSLIFWEISAIRALFTFVALGAFLAVVFSHVFEEKYQTFLLIQGIGVFACLLDPTFFYQGMEEFEGIAIRSVLVRLVCLVFVFVFVKTKDDAWIYVLVNALSSAISFIAMWPYVGKKVEHVKIKDMHIWRHFVPAFLIFLPTLAITIYSVLDKTMIGVLAKNPDYENGCYEKAYQLNSMILLLVTVISPVMIPRNAHDYAAGDTESVKRHLDFSVNYSWLIGLPLIVGTSILCYSLSSWFLGDGYEEVPLLLQIMSVRFVSSGLAVTFSDQFFIVIGKEKYTTIATAVAACLNFGLNLLFVPRWGAAGAAITTAISEITVTAILCGIAFAQHRYPAKDLFIPAIKKVIAAGIMFVPIFFMNRVMPYEVWSFIVITLVGCVTYAAALFILRDAFFLSLLSKGIQSLKRLRKKGAEVNK